MRKLLGALIVCAMLSLFQSQACQAQIVPYRLVGSGVADPINGTFYGPAIAKWIGPMNYYAQATSLVPTATGFEYTAIDTQTAWDGSEVYLDGAGSAILIPLPHLGPTMYMAVWGGEWNILGGSGRFANVGPGTAPIQLYMVQAPFDNDSADLRPFVYIKTGNWNLGRRRR